MKRQEEKKILITTLYFTITLAIILLIFSIPFLVKISKGDENKDSLGENFKKVQVLDSDSKEDVEKSKEGGIDQGESLLFQASGVITDIKKEEDELLLVVESDVKGEKIKINLLIDKNKSLKAYSSGEGDFEEWRASELKKGLFVTFDLGGGLPVSELGQGPIKIENFFVNNYELTDLDEK